MSIQRLKVTVVDQVLDVGTGRAAGQRRAIELVLLAATRLVEPWGGFDGSAGAVDHEAMSGRVEKLPWPPFAALS
ncbi:MAG: hypothetical protein WCF33_02545 [Pseudonocardiaceae bacterium]